MTAETHSQLANFIWSICNLLRGPYKRNEYRKVILPLTVLRRFDCLLAPTKAAGAEGARRRSRASPRTVVRSLLQKVTGRPFYNLSKLDLQRKLLDDPNQLAPNLNSYINGFSPNVRDDHGAVRVRLSRSRAWPRRICSTRSSRRSPTIDLSPERVDNVQMGYVFEELIRIGAEQSNEEAGEHFTPREVIKLMVNCCSRRRRTCARSHVVKTIYDPACGTGGMLSVAEKYIRDLNADAKPMLFGQDWNDEAWAVCKSDMLIKGEDADNIILGDTFTKDGFDRDERRQEDAPSTTCWPTRRSAWSGSSSSASSRRSATRSATTAASAPALPRINDGSLLFLQHMLSKMRAPKEGGSRIGIVFNGSPLFTGDAGSGESNIRQWIIENDWLEAIVALPDQLFYNTGISTYIWVLTNRKEKHAQGQGAAHRRAPVLGARWEEPRQQAQQDRRPSDKENEPDQIGDITRIFGNFRDGETRELHRGRLGHQATDRAQCVVSKVFDNADFGYPQDHRRAPAAPELPGQRRAHRPAGGRERLQEPRHQHQEEPRRPPAGDRSRQAAAGTDPRAAPRLRRSDEREALQRPQGVPDRAARGSTAARRAPERAGTQGRARRLGERDETAEICRDRDGNPSPTPTCATPRPCR